MSGVHQQNDKPFVCTASGCNMRFTNEDHLTVHKQKHEMSLALDIGQLGNKTGLCGFVADQTPTPTKFLKNCEEIGLFQDLNKNPFDEAFKRATDAIANGSEDLAVSGSLDTPVLPTSVLLSRLRKSPLADRAPFYLPVKSSLAREEVPTEPAVRRLDTRGHNGSMLISPEEEAMIHLDESDMLDTTPHQESREEFLVLTTDDDSAGSLQKDSTALSSDHVTSPQNHYFTISADHDHVTASQDEFVAIGSDEFDNELSYAMDENSAYMMLPDGRLIPIQLCSPLDSNASTSPNTTDVTSSLSSEEQTINNNFLKQRLKAVITGNQEAHVSAQSDQNDEQLGVLRALEAQHETTQRSANNLSDFTFSSKRPRRGAEEDDDDPDNRRKKFLERNRAAAARCRNKRKKWMEHLENKSDGLLAMNQRLQTEVTTLKDEVASLKLMLLAHRDCPITRQQKNDGQFNIGDMCSSQQHGGSTNPVVTSLSLPVSMPHAVKIRPTLAQTVQPILATADLVRPHTATVKIALPPLKASASHAGTKVIRLAATPAAGSRTTPLLFQSPQGAILASTASVQTTAPVHLVQSGGHFILSDGRTIRPISGGNGATDKTAAVSSLTTTNATPKYIILSK